MAASQSLTSAGVSDREADVLAALGEHLTNAEIASRLFISVRTVESHVSSLLRKLGVVDRRGLAEFAAAMEPTTAEAPDEPAVTPPHLPVPLTSFVGREAELAELTAAITAHRLVTAVGPGGVGKSRLAIAVAADRTETYADGAWFIDLVPVTDPAMVGAAVADALGVCGTQRQSIDDAVIARLATSETLLVLDNCEHLLDGVAVFVERLLAGCPQVAVLATSRARLMLPFEWVFAVPGLDPAGDAVALFRERAAAVASAELTDDTLVRVRAICEALDGMALAIELAAARLPSVGLDGIEAGLSEPMRLLSGGRRVDERHRSLRSTIDWSYDLLHEPDQALVRRVAVFAAPFTVADAATVVGFDPIDAADLAGGLARLADQSLLAVQPGTPTRYRMLETIRQYGEERLEQADELERVRSRHVEWCLATGTELERIHLQELGDWRRSLDAVIDDLRSALQWTLDRAERRRDAYELALLLGSLTFCRGRPSEAQHRFEQAATVADDPALAADALRHAAGSASTRNVGNEALRLWREAADSAIAAGDEAGAARDLALAATMSGRSQGAIANVPTPDVVEALLVEARKLGQGAPEAEAVIRTAEAFNLTELDPRACELANQALELSQQTGDQLQESAALDILAAIDLSKADLPAAVAAVRRRIDLLEDYPPSALTGHEISDAYIMASEISLAVGDLASAHDFAERIGSMVFYREEEHLANSRQLKVEAVSGEWPTLVERAARFRRGWIRAGRMVASSHALPAYAVSSVMTIRGDDAGRDEWRAIADALCADDRFSGWDTCYAPFFDAVAHLHFGRLDDAIARLAVDPGEFEHWYNGMWRPWYAAVWAEAAVLAGHSDADARVVRARLFTDVNPIATAMIDRALAVVAGDREAVLDAAAHLDAAGCRYQWARTLVLAGGGEAEEGAAALAAIGALPMATLP